ncbi:MarR family winged helix-turn-helix transcriptional regulator [Methanococcoides methylutens]|uniref:Transcriptional regulator, MarR family n=1 Tax=Methanococcoides methylutens MM1 TaxID=1434104 RepID=A0A0E3SPH3_METMT|nr:MarR family transcriptional regulator [Methanococcoides methylutens]AKB84476.1 Transcriptional regulator, MarR family [Methanococcoides methylutens MM1]
MDKIEQLIKSHFKMEHLKRKLEGNMAECILKEEEEGGCTSTHKTMGKALLLIREEGEIMPSTLARYLDLKKSSVTSLIDTLEKDGLVCRKNDPSDRRKVLVSVTKKGIEHINLMWSKAISIGEKCLVGIDDELLDRAIEAQLTLIELHQQMYERSVKVAEQKCSPESQTKK